MILNLKTDPEDIALSADVTCLFTNIPVENGERIVKDPELIESILQLIDIYLTTIYFL